MRGIDLQLFARLQIHEFRHAIDGELQLHGIEDLQEDDVVHLLAEMRERVEDGLRIVEAIGHENDEAALRELLGQRMEGFAGIGDVARFVGGEAFHEEAQMADAAARRHAVAHGIVVDGQPERILLFADEIAERGGDAAGVGVFREPIRRARDNPSNPMHPRSR